MATTHKEVYRRLEGSLDRGGPGFLPVAAGSIRVALKRKLPLLLLYLVPGIATCVSAFMAYLKFAAEESVIPEAFGGQVGFAAELLARQATVHLEARNQIVSFHAQMNMFAVLCIAWYGSGLFCDDRRSGAYQLYFSRPLTRWNYFLGKALTLAFFGGLVSFLPAFIIFIVAGFASPEWAFFKQEWDILLRSFAFSATWLSLMGSLTLFSSSCVSRKSFALLGVFCFLGFSLAVGTVLGQFIDPNYWAASIAFDMQSIAHHIFGREVNWRRVDPSIAWSVVSTLTALFLVGIGLRLARLEVVE